MEFRSVRRIFDLSINHKIPYIMEMNMTQVREALNILKRNGFHTWKIPHINLVASKLDEGQYLSEEDMLEILEIVMDDEEVNELIDKKISREISNFL